MTNGSDFVFVLEQSLGHAVHGANLERAIAARPDIDGRIIRIGPGTPGKNWSVEASTTTRRALRRAFASAPDALFIHTQVAALFAGAAMRAVPSVISMDATPLNFDSLGTGYGHERQSGPVERAKWLLNRRAFRSARAMVTWSHWAKRSLVEDYNIAEQDVHVIRPGVDLAHFRPGQRSGESAPLRVLFVGGDFPRKGGDDLLAAMARISPADAELDIVTSTPPAALPADACVRVHTGIGPGSPGLLDLYRRADIFVLPSRGECYGLVIGEALASGLAVIACGVGAVPEMVIDGYTGLVVPPAAPQALAGALETLIEQHDLRRAMGQHAVDLANREHDAERNADDIFALLAMVSSRPRVPAS